MCLSHLSNKVDSPDEGDEVEHHQTARIIVLGGLHLGQVQPLHCALEDTKYILSERKHSYIEGMKHSKHMYRIVLGE